MFCSIRRFQRVRDQSKTNKKSHKSSPSKHRTCRPRQKTKRPKETIGSCRKKTPPRYIHRYVDIMQAAKSQGARERLPISQLVTGKPLQSLEKNCQLPKTLTLSRRKSPHHSVHNSAVFTGLNLRANSHKLSNVPIPRGLFHSIRCPSRRLTINVKN